MTQPQALKCPSCTASFDYDGRSETVRCDYCGTAIIVPESIKSGAAKPGILGDEEPATAGNIHEILFLVQNGKKIEAIKLYRQTFDVSLADAKNAVEHLAHGRPTAVTYVTTTTATGQSGGGGCLVSFIVLSLMIAGGVIFFLLQAGQDPTQLIEQIREGDFEEMAQSVEGAVTQLNRDAYENAIATTAGGDGLGPDLIISNRQYGGDSIPIFYSYTEMLDGRRSVRWEVEAGTNDTYNEMSVGVDNQNVYISSGTTLQAYARNNGEQVWQTNISDIVNHQCLDCIRAEQGVVVVLTADQTLYGFAADTGQTMWQIRLQDENTGYFDEGVVPFSFINGKVAIIDDAVIDDRAVPTLYLYDLKTGEQAQLLDPHCPDMDAFFPDDTLQDSGVALINEDTDELYFIFGTSFVRQLCVQKWNPDTGEIIWENRLPPEMELGFHTWAAIMTNRSRSPFLSLSPDSLLVMVSTADVGESLAEIDLTTGETTFQLADPDYDLAPIGKEGDMILAYGTRNRGSEQMEVWGINSSSGQRSWQHILQAEYLYELDPFDDKWSYYLSPEGLIIVQLLTEEEPAQLLVQNVNVANGSLEYEKTSDVVQDNWSGLTWTPTFGYITSYSLYGINLKTGETTVEWP